MLTLRPIFSTGEVGLSRTGETEHRIWDKVFLENQHRSCFFLVPAFDTRAIATAKAAVAKTLREGVE